MLKFIDKALGEKFKFKSLLMSKKMARASIGRLFDTEFYISRYPDVRGYSGTPLEHYLRKGFREGRWPNPLLDTGWYMRQYAAVMRFRDPLVDFAVDGWRHGRNPNPLFDVEFYLDSYSDVKKSGMNPLIHYLEYGAKEGRWPNPYFDSKYYFATYPDVAELGVNPLHHFLCVGAAEGRNPSLKFSPRDYLAENTDVAAAGIHPLVHYLGWGRAEGRAPTAYHRRRKAEALSDAACREAFDALFDEAYYLSRLPAIELNGLTPREHYLTKGCHAGRDPHPLIQTNWYNEKYAGEMEFEDPLSDFLFEGWRKGRNPNPLFDVEYYLRSYPDVRSSGMNPLLHFLRAGLTEDRKPNPYFDSLYYLQTQPDVANAGLNPLCHFLTSGASEGRNPSPAFDVHYYLATNPDVRVAGINPLIHFVEHGLSEGRPGIPPQSGSAGASSHYVPPSDLLPWFSPLNVGIDPSLDQTPYLNVLVPGLGMKHMSGGPNTALNLAGRLAAAGVPVRFCSTSAPIDADSTPFWAHVCRLAGLSELPEAAQLVDMSDRAHVSWIGRNDVFLATAWWTAQMAKYATQLTSIKTFIYLIQDYEPLLHAASTAYALANETYDLNYIGVVNTALLHEFFVRENVGRFADPDFAKNTLVFNPAVDRQLFYPTPVRRGGRKRRLLFYARPGNGLRNLFEIGVAGLQKCIFDGILDPNEWEFIGMGEKFDPVDLGRGCRLHAAPWYGLDGYAQLMRDSDLLLSLMLSPHPSYPPLEMALCGHPVVTNVYVNKTADRLAAFSSNIIGVDPTIEGVSQGISTALRRGGGEGTEDDSSRLPETWEDAFAEIVPRLEAKLLELFGAPVRHRPEVADVLPGSRIWDRATGFGSWPKNAYHVLKYRRQQERAERYSAGESDLFSFLTTVWNTPPEYLLELADTVFTQDCGTRFEWILLDNGTTRQDTIEAMRQISAHPCVRFLRVDENLGIIGGMRHALGVAANRYILPLDSDDLLTPDCVRILTHVVREASYPAIVYTDEDKILGETYRDPYDKPDWDPVLFFHSCYIAHLGCIDRKLAIELGVYQDDSVTGCHDYDTFTRFYLAGYTPFHVPEVVYTWRMHPGSTAGNISSKDYISNSQRNLLEKFLSARGGQDFCVVPSPLFNNTPDWRLVRQHSRGAFVTISFGEGEEVEFTSPAGIVHARIELPVDANIRDLAKVVDGLPAGTLVHLNSRACSIEDTDWPREAMSLIELFPDTVMVGGFIHASGKITAGPGHFGLGRGCECPDLGRSTRDPGYFAQMWKPHSVASVPVEHAVVELEFLRAALGRIGTTPLSLGELGPWLGALARGRGERIVYSPFLRARAGLGHSFGLSDGFWLAFRTTFSNLLSDTHLYPRGLSRDPGAYYSHIASSEFDRAQSAPLAIAPPYADRVRAEVIVRLFDRCGNTHSGGATVGLITSVYIRTDAEFLLDLVHNIRAQTSPIEEWVILENGPISAEVNSVLDRAERDLPVRRHRVAKNLGIQGAMRYCLEHATADYIAPMDADDLLAVDAIDCIRDALVTTGADLVYTDEDLIIDGSFRAPFRRGEFDPILNAVDSYIWHLVTYDRRKALALDLYTMEGAEYCHDWDTVTRFAQARSTIHHIPAVLYHWRMHQASTSGSGAVNDGTLKSVKWMLEQEILRQARPSLYEVALFPLDRGVPQLSILRRHLGRLPLAIIRSQSSDNFPVSPPKEVADSVETIVGVREPSAMCEPSSSWLLEVVSGLGESVSHVLLLGSHICIPELPALYEAQRLFEMHPTVGAVGGRVIDFNRRIFDIAGSSFRGEAGAPHDWRGLARTNPHDYSMALKPQLATALSSCMFFVRREILVEVLMREPRSSVSDVAIGVAAARSEAGFICAYSPIIETELG